MKINLNKSTKRALSLVLAFAMLIGSLFTANVGVNITADAATLNIKYWNGTDVTAPTADAYGTYIINTPAEMAYIVSNGYEYDIGTNFKVADGIDAFIMQPESIIVDGDNNGVLDIMEIADYTKTETFFENLSGKVKWVKGSDKQPFRGNFDGNGVQIYGLYNDLPDAGWGGGTAGLFPYIGGAFAINSTDDWMQGVTIKNLAVKNSYLKGLVAGALVAMMRDSNNTATSSEDTAYKGVLYIENCEVANCFVKTVRQDNFAGVLLGGYSWGLTGFGLNVNNCIMYNNRAEDSADTPNSYGMWGAMWNGVASNNKYADKWNAGFYKYKNILSIGTPPGITTTGNNNTDAALYSNVYTDVPKADWNLSVSSFNTDQVTILSSSDDAKGSLGKLTMSMDWAVDGDTANGKWYAIDGGYPTLFKPEGWKDCETIEPWNGTAATGFAADAEGKDGDGTAENPYLIETPEQLFAMVKAGGKRTEAFTYTDENGESITLAAGTPAYYKVKDGVTDLYLSKAISGGYAAVKSLASGTAGTDYHNWNTDAWTVFEGNFDGNGVTIRGMISVSTSANTSVGLIHVLGEDAIVKNINFDTCYAYNSSAANAALLASKVIGYQDENKDGVSTSCKYCKQYAEKGTYCEFHDTYSYSSAPNGTDKDGSGKVEDCGDTQVSNCTIADSVKCENHNGGGKDGYNLIYNVSVRNSSIQSSGNSQCAGLVVSYSGYADMLQVVNCLYDGYSCELGNGATGANANAGIAAFTWNINNAMASGCVSLNAPVFTNRSTDTNYNDYTTGNKSGHPVYMYNCYTDVKENVDSTVVELVDENGASVITDDYDYITNMPLLDWVNGWYVAEDEDGRVVPMPRIRTAADVTATWDTGETVLHYNRWLSTADGGTGTSPYNGKYGHFERFVGSGTEADPYIIYTPLELARAIGVGGTNLNNKLYFKLANDIDLSDMPWLSAVGTRVTNATSTSYDKTYTYVPFEGVLDGDGHTVTGLYAVNGNADEASYGTYSNAAGLIPVLASGGVVKNLHIRDSYAGSGTGFAGALVGEAQAGSSVIGCSVEKCIVISNGTVEVDGAQVKLDYHMLGSVNGNISNLYYIADDKSTATNKTVYVNAGTVDDNGNLTGSGTVVTADAINVDYGTGAENPVWYKGGAEGSVPRLVNRAAAMTEVDVAGDDNTDYDTNDFVALRSKLLRKSAYQNIYGDVNRDGVVNSADLVIIRRAKVGDYQDIQDGFWRNVECGKVAIYYSENDTQDMARRLELYFEAEVPGIDMFKYATSSDTVTDKSLTEEDFKVAPEENAVIITQGDPASVAYNEYSVTFDSSKNLVTIYGGSFTAVEQAVIYFMANSSRATGDVYTVDDGDILTETLTDIKITNTENADTEYLESTETESEAYSYKQSVTVGGKTYYYAWGDEFDGVSDTISANNWHMSAYRGEKSDGSGSMYLNQENANLDDLNQLWVCADGRLKIWRGVNTDVYNSDSYTGEKPTDGYEWGYKGISLGTNTTNDFGKAIDANDVFIDPGLISTKESMLFKQGYIEMEASLPSDGHAFPAWWFYTYTGEKNNNNITSSLYGKIFEPNDTGANKWIGAKSIDGSLSSYKYKLPTAYLEFDIVETMQTLYSGYTGTTAYKPSEYQFAEDTYNHYKRDFSLTVHKTYKSNVINDVYYLIDWDNGTSKTVDWDTFNTGWGSTSDDHGWTHAYNSKASDYGSYDIQTAYAQASTQNGSSYLGKNMTATVKYGFAWNVDVSNKTYNLDVYVSTDGKIDTETAVLHIDEETGHQYQDTIWDNKANKETADAELWNQYAYMLIDNGFYTANSGKYTKFEDLLTQNTSGATDYWWDSWGANNYQIMDKTTFEINYVRVYQQDGMRDIVTRDTEAFNTGNHFGYGE